MSNVWLQSALWMALALVAALGSLYITIAAALFEIVAGAIAGNTIGLPLTDWISYIAGFGAVVLTFLAGSERLGLAGCCSRDRHDAGHAPCVQPARSPAGRSCPPGPRRGLHNAPCFGFGDGGGASLGEIATQSRSP